MGNLASVVLTGFYLVVDRFVLMLLPASPRSCSRFERTRGPDVSILSMGNGAFIRVAQILVA